MGKLNLLSANVRGLNTDEKRRKIYSWLHESKIDIAFLQETHFIQKFETKYNTGWKGQPFHTYSDLVFSRGVSIYFRENFDVKIVNVKRAIDGRKILINVELNGYIFSLINIYAPNTGSKRSEFFENLQCFITKHCLNDNILICGDFNCQLNDEKDKSVHILKKMIDKLRLTDLWKKNLLKFKRFNMVRCGK